MHQNHLAALLATGELLIAGGTANGAMATSSQTYDPKTNAWTPVGAPAFDHDEAAMNVLADGTVLATGSWGTKASFNEITSSCEIFDPAKHAWVITSSMKTSHGNHTATVLADGRVLVAGGFTAQNGGLAESGVGEIYDPLAQGAGGAGGAGSTTSSTTSASTSALSSSTDAASASGAGGGSTAGSGGAAETGGDATKKGCSCTFAGADGDRNTSLAALALACMLAARRRRRG